MRRARLLLALLALSCSSASDPTGGATPPPTGKADGFAEDRVWEVLLTAPHCDVCTSADKKVLLDNSKIVARVIEVIGEAQETIDVAQFTFSNRDIEAALIEAHEEGKRVRVAINHAQQNGDTVAKRLAAAGLDVEFVEGKETPNFIGLQHAKYMIVDGTTLLMGSNNWSSTGTSINNENTLVVTSSDDDPLLQGFACYFDAMHDGRIGDAPACSTEEVLFTPSSGPSKLIRDQIRSAEHSVDVFMHHLLFKKSIKELTKAAQKDGVRVRVIANAADRDEFEGGNWDAFRAAGGEIRFKQTNPELFQIMHHKLAIIDGERAIVGSGNWSGSAFFNNYEFYLLANTPDVVTPLKDAFGRLWAWSLGEGALDGGLTADQQHAAETEVFFGNLHAHYQAGDEERIEDDGKLARIIDGVELDVSDELDGRSPSRFAYEYARDEAGLDFLALSPHVVDERPDDPKDLPNMSDAGYVELVATSRDINKESEGIFVALPSMEWSTNSTGNHVGILGSSELARVQRGRFDLLFEEFLPKRQAEGDAALVMFNHPRTFRRHDVLEGSWDQIFGVNLTEIPRVGDRNKKFNDFGLDDFEPLRSVRDSWIAGDVEPDEATVFETLDNIRAASAPYARVFEVTVARGTEFADEEPRNPSLSEDELGEITRFTKVHSDWDYYLTRGFKFAPVSNHDNHFANWGTGHTSRTAVIAPALSEAELLSAIERRSVYATEDENLELRMYADHRIPAGQSMATTNTSVALTAFLSDPDIAGSFRVRVFRGTVGNPEVAAVLERELTPDTWHELEVDLPNSGEHFVYLEVEEPNQDRHSWSAPIWVTRLGE